MSDEFDLVLWARSRCWYVAADYLARAGHPVVVHDPTAPDEYRDLNHSGMLSYHTPDGRYAAGCGCIHIVRGKRADVTMRILEAR